MLTIKIVGSDGNEAVHEAKEVFMIPSSHAKMINGYVYYFVPGESTARDIVDGDVYVMNDYGKTIADYHIRPPKNEEVKAD